MLAAPLSTSSALDSGDSSTISTQRSLEGNSRSSTHHRKSNLLLVPRRLHNLQGAFATSKAPSQPPRRLYNLQAFNRRQLHCRCVMPSSREYGRERFAPKGTVLEVFGGVHEYISAGFMQGPDQRRTTTYIGELHVLRDHMSHTCSLVLSALLDGSNGLTHSSFSILDSFCWLSTTFQQLSPTLIRIV